MKLEIFNGTTKVHEQEFDTQDALDAFTRNAVANNLFQMRSLSTRINLSGTFPVTYRDFRRMEFMALDSLRDEAMVERLQGRPARWNEYTIKRQAIKLKYPKPPGTPEEVESPVDKAVRLLGNMVTPQYYMLARLEMENGNDSLWKDMDKRYKKLLQDNGIQSKDLVILKEK